MSIESDDITASSTLSKAMATPPRQKPTSAREEIAAILAADPISPIVAKVIEVLLVRIEKQADAIVKLQQKASMLDSRTVGSILVK